MDECWYLTITGKLTNTRGNDRFHQPISHPKSMEMPIEASLPEHNEWTEDMYTTWQSRQQNPNISNFYAPDELTEGIEDYDHYGTFDMDSTIASTINSSTIVSQSTDHLHAASEDANSRRSAKRTPKKSVEEAPQVGTLCTVRLKIGEKVSRVSHSYSSHLRRSRWRRKHFPKGSFPYDNIIVQRKVF